MTPVHVETLEQSLDQAGATYRSELYEGAAHGYTMSDTAAYDEAAAERHFSELFALLDRTIAAQGQPATLTDTSRSTKGCSRSSGALSRRRERGSFHRRQSSRCGFHQSRSFPRRGPCR